jgi:ABC-type multidrug transport system permease subunit
VGGLATGFLTGCSPELDVAGVYFPGWLLSAVIGLLFAAVAATLLSRHRATSDLGQSGVFFLALAALVFFLTWRIFFGWIE